MNDMGSGNFRTFDPAKEDGAEPRQPRGNSLRDRIKRSEQAQQPASGASRSGYVHQPQADAEMQPQAQPNHAPQPAAEPQQSAPVPQQSAPAQPQAEIQPTPAPAPVRAESPAPATKPEAKPERQEQPQQLQAAPGENGAQPIGVVLEISGAGSQVAIDLQRLGECSEDEDPSVAMAGQVGSQIKIRVGNNWLLASVRNQKQDRKAGSILANIDFLGEGVEEKLTGRLHGFRRGVTRYPVPGAMVYPASTADLKQVYASDGRSAVTIGRVYPTKDIRAGLYVDAMLGKHFALLGSTGTGKSTSAALILHRICEAAPEGHIVMVDPHGEYSAAFRQTGVILDVSNLQMPYWIMNFEEHCEVLLTSNGNDRQVDADILARCLLKARQKSRLAEQMGKITVDSPIPYLLSDLSNAIQDAMGKLDKATNSAPYMRIKNKLDELKTDPRYQFMFSGMLVADTMSDFISKIFRMPANGKPISIIDVSGVPSDITSTVVAVLSRLVFDFAIWGREEKTTPILLVCEEAHRYVPSEQNANGNSVGTILSRIAKEGRKYGISLGLITQRPSDLAEGVLSQCGTIISMRLNNDRDQDFVRAAMPEGARGFLDAIPALRNRECIICGEGVAIPIRVSFDNLEEIKRPASEDPSFVELWSQSGGEEDIVQRTVQRWRSQG
ncbi:ATP-binding protein [Qipengyuania psychrotolerans]|uniref:ATP-binding protein n=1 Tax=Qipengyuania psychrotolerans TaxID=2867238 RepID=UPI001FFD2B24|nr:ATP-binding protein [Qipengyuania psychrotolerans]